MEKDLIPGMPIVPANVTYIKEKQDKTFNIDNSTVNFNIQLPEQTAAGTSEQMIAIQSFSNEYYQLLVTGEEDVFSTNMVTFDTSRALPKRLVPDEIFERCSTLTEAGIEELKTFPAVICIENKELHGKADPTQWAMYGYIRKVQISRKNVKVVFAPIAPFPQSKLCEKTNAVFFDLNMDCAITDLNHSAWSVHKTNLFEAFDEAGLSNLPRPY